MDSTESRRSILGGPIRTGTELLGGVGRDQAGGAHGVNL